MKKIMVIIAVLIGAILMNVSNGAVSAKGSGIDIVIDGKTQYYDVAPVIIKGSILVPMRAIFEKFDATINWDSGKQQVSATKGSTHIVLTINSTTAMIDGKTVVLNTAPRILNGSTMIPLRIVGEAFGANVKWVSEKNTVDIVSSPNGDGDNKEKVEGQSSQPSTPTTYDSTNGNLTLDELNILLLANSKKGKESFNAVELKSLNIAMTMDKNQIIEMLVGQYNYENPNAQNNRNIVKFIEQYLVNELQWLTKYSFNNSDSENTGYVINLIINAMPDDKKLKAMSVVLEEHPNSGVRYNAAYLISKFNSEEAFNELAKVVSSEKDELVFGNVVAAAIKVGGTNKDKISTLFHKYNDLSDELKSKFSSMLFSLSYSDNSLKSAWKAFLDDKLNTGTDTEKNNIEVLIDEVD